MEALSLQTKIFRAILKLPPTSSLEPVYTNFAELCEFFLCHVCGYLALKPFVKVSKACKHTVCESCRDGTAACRKCPKSGSSYRKDKTLYLVLKETWRMCQYLTVSAIFNNPHSEDSDRTQNFKKMVIEMSRLWESSDESRACRAPDKKRPRTDVMEDLMEVDDPSEGIQSSEANEKINVLQDGVFKRPFPVKPLSVTRPRPRPSSSFVPQPSTSSASSHSTSF